MILDIYNCTPVFSKEDKVVIKSLYEVKGYNALDYYYPIGQKVVTLSVVVLRHF